MTRMPFQARVVGVEVQRAEAQAKRLLRFDRDVLVPEEDHAVVDQRVVYLRKLGGVEVVPRSMPLRRRRRR